jgi:Tol biopolymer transport system component
VEGGVLSLINADGTDPHFIVSAHTLVSAPSWSPDGKTIVYAAGGYSNTGHLYTIDTAGNNGTDLTPFPLPIDSRDPNWSHH